MSQPELQYAEQLPLRKGNRQKQHLETGHAQCSPFNVVFMDSYVRDISEINSVERRKEHISYKPLEAQPDVSGSDEIRQPAAESSRIVGGSDVSGNGSKNDKIKEWKKNHIPCLDLKALGSQRKKKHVKRSLSLTSLKIKKSTLLSVHQNPTGPHCCQVCGKIFHYMQTLWIHVQTHTADKIHICGICGKHLESAESLVQHLQAQKEKRMWYMWQTVFR